MKKSAIFFTVVLVPLDFLMLLSAGLSAYFLRTSSVITDIRPVLFYINLPLEKYVFMLFVIIPFWLLIFALTGLYKIKRASMLEEFFQIVASVSFAMMGLIIFIFVQREWFDSRFIILAAWLFAIGFVWFGRWILKAVERHFISTHKMGVERVLIIGDDHASHMLIREIEQKPALGYLLVKHLLKIEIDEIKKAIDNPKIDTVIVAQTDFTKDSVVELAELCQEYRLNFRFVPTLFQTFATNVGMDMVGGIPLIEVKQTPLDGWGKVLKRVVDWCGSLCGLIVLAPFFGIVAACVKLDSRGPVFVSLNRITQGRVFKLYKFRSMIDNAHTLNQSLRAQANDRAQSGPLWKMKKDPRVTRVGRFIRKTRIDELPQLWNVFKGDMSLVGPRPHEPEEVAQYEKHHKKLLTVKAGMTGMAQISGSSDLSFEEEVKLDTFYIERWTLFLDLKILARTLTIIIRDRSAC